jgi:hypothetical protein
MRTIDDKKNRLKEDKDIKELEEELRDLFNQIKEYEW